MLSEKRKSKRKKKKAKENDTNGPADTSETNTGVDDNKKEDEEFSSGEKSKF